MPHARKPDVYTSHNISLYARGNPVICRFTFFHPLDMLLLRTVAPWLLLACLAQQVSVSTGARDGKGRKGKGGGLKPEQPPTPAPRRPERGDGQPGGKSAATKGKFTTKDNMQCTWAAQGEDTVTLRVNCKNPEAASTGGESQFSCNYKARPATCPGFGTNPASYWKQVARSLKKLQRKLCKDQRALVKTGMCKRAPQDAHFKLHSSGTTRPTPKPHETTARTTAKTTTTTIVPARRVTQGPAGTSSACTENVDQRKLAEEYCSNSWASLCTFFFSMVQSGDC